MDEAFDIELRVLSQPRYACVVRSAIAAAVEKLGVPDDVCGQVMLAVDEAVTNIIRHGYPDRDDGPITVRFAPLESDATRAAFRIVIEDEGEQIESDQIKGRDLDDVRPGGLGVHIIREVMDAVTYTPRREGGMRVEMTKAVELPAPSQSADIAEPPGTA